MSLRQEERDVISKIASMMDEKADNPLVGVATFGGLALASKLSTVADKESAAEALFAIGSSSISAADPFDDDDFMQMQLGIISLYAANELLK